MKAYHAIYLFVVIIGIIIINGCSPYSTSLKGKYVDSPVVITSTKSVDSSWSNITQLFVKKGLSIKKLEKEKGVITSTTSSFIPVYTFEDEDGQLVEPKAWIVLRKVFVNKKPWNSKKIHCQWNIQITETEKGGSMIRVDPVVICIYYPNMFTSMESRSQSTGKLEELIMKSK